jgi:hypothetical protein
MMIIEIREAFWTAPALWRFARKRTIRRRPPLQQPLGKLQRNDELEFIA